MADTRIINGQMDSWSLFVIFLMPEQFQVPNPTTGIQMLIRTCI